MKNSISFFSFFFFSNHNILHISETGFWLTLACPACSLDRTLPPRDWGGGRCDRDEGSIRRSGGLKKSLFVRGLHAQLSCALQWREENKKESHTAALNGRKVAKSKVEALRKKKNCSAIGMHGSGDTRPPGQLKGGGGGGGGAGGIDENT